MVNIYGLVGVILFHIIVLIIGVLFTRKKNDNDTDCVLHENMLLAGRKVGYIVGVLSITATWISGILIYSSVASISTKGLVHSQLLWSFPITLIIGGTLFSRQMRNSDHITILDPLQEKFGKIIACILYIPALLNEFMWCAASLAVLSLLFRDVFDDNYQYLIILPVFVIIMYCVFGGNCSIVYTSSLLLVFIVIGLTIFIPFAVSNDHVIDVFSPHYEWLGELKEEQVGPWMDITFMMIFGLLPWQSYVQHGLSTYTPTHAQVTSYISAFICCLFCIPVTTLSSIYVSTDWNSLCAENTTSLNSTAATTCTSTSYVTMTMQHLVPLWVTYIMVCVISAAVISSADSAIFSASSMFSHNIYHMTIRQKASSKELILVLRIVIFFISICATVVAMTTPNIYRYWLLTIDFVYVILFPQFFSAVCLNAVNEYGSITALIMGLAFRLCGGVHEIGMPILIKFPFFDEKANKQFFPFRTFIMLFSLFLLIIVSLISNYYINRNRTEISQDEIDIIRISYREPAVERVTSFSKIASWAGSYNSITASANDLRHTSKEERLLLKATMNRTLSNSKSRMEASRNSYLL